ncbi:tetratricopeptide repeat protein [Sorangium sp. So ce134]
MRATTSSAASAAEEPAGLGGEEATAEPVSFERALGSERGAAYRRFVEWSVGAGFMLAIVEVRRPAQREALVVATRAAVPSLCLARLASLDARPVRTLIEEVCPSPAEASVLMLTHLEESRDAARICAELNVHRDELARRFALPWVLVVHPAAALALQRYAPDFCDFAGLWLPEEPDEGTKPLMEQAIRSLATSGASPHHLSPDTTTAPKDLLSLAHEAAVRGHVDRAADLLAQHDMKYPDAKIHNVRRVYMEGLLLRIRGRLVDAIARFDAALELCETADDPYMRAVLLDELAHVYLLQGDLTAARHLERDALELFEQLGDQRNRAASLRQLSVIEKRLGHDAKARELEEESLQLSEKLGDQVEQTMLLSQLLTDEGNYTEARELLRDLLAMSDKLGDRDKRFASLRQIARIAIRQSNYAEARELLRESLKLSEEMENTVYRLVALRALADVAWLEGNFADAQELLRESLKLSEELGTKHERATSLITLGLLEADEGHIDRSLALVRAGASILKDLESPDLEQAKNIQHSLESLLGADSSQ